MRKKRFLRFLPVRAQPSAKIVVVELHKLCVVFFCDGCGACDPLQGSAWPRCYSFFFLWLDSCGARARGPLRGSAGSICKSCRLLPCARDPLRGCGQIALAVAPCVSSYGLQRSGCKVATLKYTSSTRSTSPAKSQLLSTKVVHEARPGCKVVSVKYKSSAQSTSRSSGRQVAK